jgi:membrane protein DedA with SNARE-associated domain
MDFILNYINEIGYFGIFLFLLLCGLGLPFPEDLILIISGYLVYLGRFRLAPTILICLLGVLIGDLLIFRLGHKWRNSNHKILKKFITESRLNRAHAYFDKYGGKTIFILRFLPGVRAAGFLTAGLVKMKLSKFLGLDFLASLISVPTITYFAYYFGWEIDYVLNFIKKTRIGIFCVIGLVVAIYTIKHFLKNKSKKS